MQLLTRRYHRPKSHRQEMAVRFCARRQPVASRHVGTWARGHLESLCLGATRYYSTESPTPTPRLVTLISPPDTPYAAAPENGGRPGPAGPDLPSPAPPPADENRRQARGQITPQRVSQQPPQRSTHQREPHCQPSNRTPTRQHEPGTRHHRSDRPAGTRYPESKA